MLAKVVWKTSRKDSTIWMELVNQKYLKGQNILQYSAKPGDSPMWKGIVRCAHKLKSSFRWRVGNGEKINFWFDIWFKDRALFSFIESVDNRDLSVSLSQVLMANGQWNFSSLHTTIPPLLAEELRDSQTQLSEESDTLLWNETATGLFSCQSAYHTLHRQNYHSLENKRNYIYIWKGKLTNKMKHFLWFVAQDRLLTNSLRYKRHFATDPICVQCNIEEEDVLQIFRYCRTATLIWKEVLTDEDLLRFKTCSDAEWLKKNLQVPLGQNSIQKCAGLPLSQQQSGLCGNPKIR